MTARSAIPDGIVRAERLVATALHHWDAASLTRCSECGEKLALALAEIETAQSAGLLEPKAAAGMAERIRKIQADSGRLARLVDAAAAFNRGLVLLIGAEPAAAPAAFREG